MKKVLDFYYLFVFGLHVSLSNKMSKIIKYASYSVMSLIESGIILYEHTCINSINNHT